MMDKSERRKRNWSVTEGQWLTVVGTISGVGKNNVIKEGTIEVAMKNDRGSKEGQQQVREGQYCRERDIGQSRRYNG
jgi:hypothetical protein